MKTIVSTIKQQTLEEFANEHKLTMLVTERNPNDLGSRWHPVFRFYAQFDGASVKNGPMLTGAHGNGETIDDAIEEYMREISGQTLILGAYTDSRKEIKVPSLTSVS